MLCFRCDVARLILTTASCITARVFDIGILYHEKRDNTTEVVPAPIVVPPSQYFDGIDGSWSTFNVRVGTPAQSVRVIASTNSPQTLVVRPQGCLVGAIPNGVPTNCVSFRGGTFDSDRSRSWIDQGWFGLNGGQFGYEANLEYNFNLDYGLDTLGLGFQVGDAPTLKNQTISAYNLPNPLYLGQFGLGTQSVIYSTFGNYSVDSFFVTLRNQTLIPSLSWSYTAGASYRLAAGQYSQLIFGGYDASRFQPNDVQFFLSPDVTRDIVVGVQSILYTGTTSLDLLSEPIYAFIESTDPNIWLPLSACLQFEQAFGLTFDNATQKYLMNTTQFTALSAANPSVTFRLASSTTGGATADIVLPFDAFGLKAAYPFVPNTTYYFPLKRAVNETQYTLGRAFLQEAYLTVDYDRRNFSVSQCTFQQSASQQVNSILAPISLTNGTNTNSTTDHSSSGGEKKTNTPAIAGVVATVAVLAIIGSVGFWFWHRRKQQKQKIEEGEPAATTVPLPLRDMKAYTPQVSGPALDDEDNFSTYGRYKKDEPMATIYSHTGGEYPSHGQEIHEAPAHAQPSEMGDTDSRIRYELPTPMPVEMEGNSHWEDREVPNHPVGRSLLSSYLNHANSIGSVASTAGLIGAPVAWHSVSSRVSSRSAATEDFRSGDDKPG